MFAIWIIDPMACIHKQEVKISFDLVSSFPSIPINLTTNMIEMKWDIIT